MIFKNLANQDWTDFNFIESGLEFSLYRTGLGPKNFIVRSSLVQSNWFFQSDVLRFCKNESDLC